MKIWNNKEQTSNIEHEKIASRNRFFLYAFYTLNSIAITIASMQIFWDKLFLRMDLNMAQFGIIKAIGVFLPVTISLLLSPMLLKINREREIVALAYLSRVAIFFLFLTVPLISDSTSVRTLLCLILVTSHTIPMLLANNCLSVLCKEYLPEKKLGKYITIITNLWLLPGMMTAVLAGWYLDKFETSSDTEFYHAFFVILLATTIFQIPASIVIMKTKRQPREVADGISLKSIMNPFKDQKFRTLLSTIFLIFVLLSMTVNFINPYLIRVYSMSVTEISIITAVLATISIVARSKWGGIADRFGARNTLRVAILGVSIGCIFLTGETYFSLFIFIALAWNGLQGLAGLGIRTCMDCLTLSMSKKKEANIYFAAAMFMIGCGSFVGSLTGGFTLEWMSKKMDPTLPWGQHYCIYYLFISLLWLLVMQSTSGINEPHQRVGTLKLSKELMRSFFYIRQPK